jgi:hypothetical protein
MSSRDVIRAFRTGLDSSTLWRRGEQEKPPLPTNRHSDLISGSRLLQQNRHLSDMQLESENVSLSGKTGSDRCAVKITCLDISQEQRHERGLETFDNQLR